MGESPSDNDRWYKRYPRKVWDYMSNAWRKTERWTEALEAQTQKMRELRDKIWCWTWRTGKKFLSVTWQITKVVGGKTWSFLWWLTKTAWRKTASLREVASKQVQKVGASLKRMAKWKLAVMLFFIAFYGALIVWPLIWLRTQIDYGLGQVPWKWIGLGIVALAVLVLVIWLVKKFWTSSDSPASTPSPAPASRATVRARTSFSFGWIPGLILGLAAVCGVVYLGYLLINKWELSRTVMSERTAARTVSTTSLPADVALPIIAQCESGGRQFEDDGVTPLRNREGSSAFGKYQFLESHREPAQKLGFDLNTEEGQDGYARHLYGVSGTQDWEADLRSRECWEPQIATLSGQRELIYTIIAPTEGWTSIQKFPHEVWPRVEIKAVREEGQFAIRRNRKIYKFTPDNSDAIPGIINQVELQALGESPEEIWIRLYR